MVTPITDLPVARKRPVRKAAPKLKMIRDDMVRGQQSIELHQLFELKGHKLRLIIDSDSTIRG